MLLWNLRKQIAHIQAQKLSTFKVTLYSFLLSFSFSIGISALNILQTFYYSLFSALKDFLEKQASPVPLFIKVHTQYLWFSSIINLVLFLTGILLLLAQSKKDLQRFFYEFISITWILNIKIALISIFLYVCLFFSTLFFFWYKFSLTTKQTFQPLALGLVPLKTLLKGTKIIPIAQKTLDQTSALYSAQQLFNLINKTSYIFYWIALISSVICTLLLLRTTAQVMKKL